MTSSAMWLASRPTRAESRGTVPWNRVGWVAGGVSGGGAPGPGPSPENWALSTGHGFSGLSGAGRLRPLGIELSSRDIRLDEQPGRIGIGQRNDLSAA